MERKYFCYCKSESHVGFHCCLSIAIMQFLAAKHTATAYSRTSNVWFNTKCNRTQSLGLAPTGTRHWPPAVVKHMVTSSISKKAIQLWPPFAKIACVSLENSLQLCTLLHLLQNLAHHHLFKEYSFLSSYTYQCTSMPWFTRQYMKTNLGYLPEQRAIRSSVRSRSRIVL